MKPKQIMYGSICAIILPLNLMFTLCTAQITVNPADYAPLVYLHPEDLHRPMDIMNFLKKASLYEKNNKVSGTDMYVNLGPIYDASGTTRLINISDPQYSNEDYMLGIQDYHGSGDDLRYGRDWKNDITYSGDPLVADKCTAPVYVNTRINAVNNTVDIVYAFFFEWNGIQTFRGKFLSTFGANGKKRDFEASEMARHEGDFEHITVRINSNSGDVISVIRGGHGRSHEIKNLTGDIDFVAGSNLKRPIIYCALNSHATYTKIGTHRAYKDKEKEAHIIGYGAEYPMPWPEVGSCGLFAGMIGAAGGPISAGLGFFAGLVGAAFSPSVHWLYTVDIARKNTDSNFRHYKRPTQNYPLQEVPWETWNNLVDYNNLPQVSEVRDALEFEGYYGVKMPKAKMFKPPGLPNKGDEMLKMWIDLLVFLEGLEDVDTDPLTKALETFDKKRYSNGTWSPGKNNWWPLKSASSSENEEYDSYNINWWSMSEPENMDLTPINLIDPSKNIDFDDTDFYDDNGYSGENVSLNKIDKIKLYPYKRRPDDKDFVALIEYEGNNGHTFRRGYNPSNPQGLGYPPYNPVELNIGSGDELVKIISGRYNVYSYVPTGSSNLLIEQSEYTGYIKFVTKNGSYIECGDINETIKLDTVEIDPKISNITGFNGIYYQYGYLNFAPNVATAPELGEVWMEEGDGNASLYNLDLGIISVQVPSDPPTQTGKSHLVYQYMGIPEICGEQNEELLRYELKITTNDVSNSSGDGFKNGLYISALGEYTDYCLYIYIDESDNIGYRHNDHNYSSVATGIQASEVYFRIDFDGDRNVNGYYSTDSVSWNTIASDKTVNFMSTMFRVGSLAENNYYYSALNSTFEPITWTDPTLIKKCSDAPIKHVVVEADSYVKKFTPNTNYGTEELLLIDQRMSGGTNISDQLMTYLKFDLTSLAGKYIGNVKLKLYHESSGSDIYLDDLVLKQVDNNSWTETGITWNNRPTSGSQLSSVDGHSSTLEFDVTSYIINRLSTYNYKASFSLENILMGGGAWFKYHSKEGVEGVFSPFLEVTLMSAKDRSCSETIYSHLFPDGNNWCENKHLFPVWQGTFNTVSGDECFSMDPSNGDYIELSPRSTNGGILHDYTHRRDVLITFELENVSGTEDVTYTLYDEGGDDGGFYMGVNRYTNTLAVNIGDGENTQSFTVDYEFDNNVKYFVVLGYIEYDDILVVFIVNYEDFSQHFVRFPCIFPEIPIHNDADGLGSIRGSYVGSVNNPSNLKGNIYSCEIRFCEEEDHSIDFENKSLEPIADAYVQGGSYSGNNFGGSDKLIVKDLNNNSGTRRSFLRFDLSSITQSITKALLVLYVEYGGNTVEHEIKKVSNDTWSESGINFNNQPSAGSLLSQFDGVLQGHGEDNPLYFVVDITDYANSEISGDGLLSLRIASTEDVTGGGQDFYSKEADNILVRPKLIIYHDSGSEAIIKSTEIEEGGIAIQEQEKGLTDLLIYPNPVNDKLHIENSIAIGKVEVYNISGGLLITEQANAVKKFAINTDELKNGTYILKLSNTDGTISVVKFVK